MKNEAEFKLQFKKSVSKHGGYCMTLAAPMISGIPDLYVIMPGYLPIVLEAKWMGKIIKSTFNRKPQFTPMQEEWLNELHKRVSYSALGLMGFIYNDKVHAAFIVPTTQQFSRFNHNFVFDCAYCAIDKHKDFFNIPLLFSKVPIPRIHADVKPGDQGDGQTEINDTTGSAGVVAIS